MATESALRTALAERVGRQRYDLWFGENTKLAVESHRVVVAAPNAFFQDWLRRHFRDQIESAMAEVIGRAAVLEFQVHSEQAGAAKRAIAAETVTAAGEPASSAGEVEIPLLSVDRRPAGRRFARLDSFVVGDSNRLAATTVELVAGQLGRWSPLLVHGPTGVGKTHLLEGLWSAVRKKAPEATAVFLSAEQFTSYFLEALRGSGLPSFRRKYRGVDLLIIDDLQFFAGKRATLIELLYTVNSLTDEGRQIVFAADRPPAELDELGKDLVHRLNGGMVCRIDPPDHQIRLGIVKQLARNMDLQLPDEVAGFVASNLTSNARELAGAVNRLHAARITLGRPLSLELAHEALGEMIRDCAKMVHLHDIEAAVCRVFGLEKQTLQSDRRAREVSYPRMLAMWLARKHTRSALSEIGHYFGRRTHSTVVSAQKKVGGWLEKQEMLELGGGRCTVEEAIRRVERLLHVG